jgi:hypothetical protein
MSREAEAVARFEDAAIYRSHKTHPAQRPRDYWGRINGLGCVCQDCDRYLSNK